MNNGWSEEAKNALAHFMRIEEMRKVVIESNDWHTSFSKWILNTKEVLPSIFAGTPVENWEPGPTIVVTPAQLHANDPAASSSEIQDVGGEDGGGAGMGPMDLEGQKTGQGLGAKRQENTDAANRAKAVLEKADGPMRLEDIFQSMKDAGWLGFSGIKEVSEELRVLYRVLQSRDRVFGLAGRNIWKLQGQAPGSRPIPLEDMMT